MTSSIHTVPIIQVQSILQGAAHQGRDVPAILRQAGISPELLQSPRSRVSQQQYSRLIRVLRRVMRDELWGLCQRPLPIGSFAQATQLMVRAGTLGDALRAGSHFYHLLLDDFVIRILSRNGTARVRVISRRQPNPRHQYAKRTAMFFTFGLASWLVERRLPVTHVCIEEPALRERADTGKLFQAPIHYDQHYTELCFNADWLQYPVRQDAFSLREFLQQAPTNLLVKYRDQAVLSERLRRYVRRHLDTRVPSLNEVAAELCVTPQTLRRRLRDEGEGYQTIKDEVRRDAALHLLSQPDLSLVEIANRTGFSEPSTFHRAFKKWTGLAPQAYRQTVLAPGRRD